MRSTIDCVFMLYRNDAGIMLGEIENYARLFGVYDVQRLITLVKRTEQHLISEANAEAKQQVNAI